MVRKPDVERSFELPSGHQMTVRTEFDERGKLRDLAIMVRLANATEVARLDTSHGQLHTHYYGKGGQAQERRSVLCELPADPIARGDVLHEWYEVCYDVMAAVAEGRAP